VHLLRPVREGLNDPLDEHALAIHVSNELFRLLHDLIRGPYARSSLFLLFRNSIAHLFLIAQLYLFQLLLICVADALKYLPILVIVVIIGVLVMTLIFLPQVTSIRALKLVLERTVQ